MLLVGVAFTWWTPGYSTAKVNDLPPSTPPAETLLARTQIYLNESLANMDRLLDHLQAAILLSYFFFQQGRLEEGSIISSSNSRFAFLFFSLISLAPPKLNVHPLIEWRRIAAFTTLIKTH